jgi:hypothetical protein
MKGRIALNPPGPSLTVYRRHIHNYILHPEHGVGPEVTARSVREFRNRIRVLDWHLIDGLDQCPRRGGLPEHILTADRLRPHRRRHILSSGADDEVFATHVE